MMHSILAVAVMALSASAPGTATVEQQKWQSRLLIIFAPAPNSVDLGKQRLVVNAATAAFAERDLIVVEVVGDGVTGAADTAPALRARYAVPPASFQILLVGKDGGVKLRSDRPIALMRLIGTVDAMPMRRGETLRR